MVLSKPTYSQSATFATLYGYVLDESGMPLPGVNVIPLDSSIRGTSTDGEGYFEIRLRSNANQQVIFSFIGFNNDTARVFLLPGSKLKFDVTLKTGDIELIGVDIEARTIREQAGTSKIDVKDIDRIPTPMGGIEAALVSQALGVSSTNEMSSVYSVRGGNFDENLVYVNDFEVYRPFLIRSGQQEGLSFVNPDLVSGVEFSSGGFMALYGDKLSSVLDVSYKKPRKWGGSVSGSFLGFNAHFEGASKNERFTMIAGFRQRANRYLLNTLDLEGQYVPSFLDAQTFMTYRFNDKWEVQYILNYARNRFDFIPATRETTFGAVNQVLRLTMFFEGAEKDRYRTLMNGLAVVYRPTQKTRIKWLHSVYNSVEVESYDILAEYFLDEVETDFGREDFGQRRFNLGVGGILDYARNQLNWTVANSAIRASTLLNKHHLQYGFKYQREWIDDRINEWSYLDSAGYALPFSENEVNVSEVIKSRFKLQSTRLEGYLQDSWRISEARRFIFTYGIRFSWWDVNKEWVISPRAQISYQPSWKRDIVFRAAAGLYNQPPFYREMRDLDGSVNTSLRAQKSAHFVLGADMNFKAWGRDFKFVTEAYYKYLYDMVPFEFDNVLIRYYGENLSKGYAAGIDMRLHGEFVKSTDSYISLSFMSTKEDVRGDFYDVFLDENGRRVFQGSGEEATIVDTQRIFPGMIPRPTDQRVRFGMFFQDYLPRNENFKMHLNLIVATGLPFGPPDRQRWNDVFRIPPYRRVDIGFSAQLFDKKKSKIREKHPLRVLESAWVTAEVWNLLGVNNAVSYLWVKDIQNTVYAVPNYLSNRLFNARLIVKW